MSALAPTAHALRAMTVADLDRVLGIEAQASTAASRLREWPRPWCCGATVRLSRCNSPTPGMARK